MRSITARKPFGEMSSAAALNCPPALLSSASGRPCRPLSSANKAAIEAVLLAIKTERPDLRLHGFGVKTTALGSRLVRDLLHTADSMAWSFAARKQGRNANDYREAVAFKRRIDDDKPDHDLLSLLWS